MSEIERLRAEVARLKDELGKARQCRNCFGGAGFIDSIEEETSIFQTLSDATEDMIFFKDLDFVYQGVNDAFAAFAGATREKVVGKTDEELFAPKTARLLRNLDRQMLIRWERKAGQVMIIGPDGAERFFQTLLSPLKTREGKICGIVGVFRDITNQRLIDRRLQLSEARHRAVFEHAGIGIATAALDGTVLSANPALHTMLAVEDTLVGRTIEDFLPEEDRAKASSILQDTASGKMDHFTIESRLIRDDKRVLRGQHTITLVRSRHGQPRYLLVMVEDVTSRFEAVEALRDSENRYRTIFDTIASATIITHFDRTIRLVNRGFESITGYSREEVQGKISLSDTVIEEDRAEYLEQVRPLETNPTMELHGREIRVLTKNGDVKTVSYSVSHIPDTEYRVVSALDITAQVEAKKALERYSEELEERVAERTAELNETNLALRAAKEDAEAASTLKTHFLALVSHELQTPLTSIRGFAQIVDRKLRKRIAPLLGDDLKAVQEIERIQENLSIILADGERLNELVNNVLDLTRLEAGDIALNLEEADLAELAVQAVEELQPRAERKGLKVSLSGADRSYSVWGDRQRLAQIVDHLVSNAIKFTEQGAVTCELRQDGNTMVFSVRDTGPGIPPEKAEAVFDRFEQLSDSLTGKPTGTGLGLALCKELATWFEGTISLESKPGQGSVFSLHLPAHSS